MSHGHGYYAASAHLISVQAGRLGSVLTYWLRQKEKVLSGRREPFASTTQRTLKKTKVLYSIIAVAAAIVYNFQKKDFSFGHTAEDLNETAGGLYRKDGQHWDTMPSDA